MNDKYYERQIPDGDKKTVKARFILVIAAAVTALAVSGCSGKKAADKGTSQNEDVVVEIGEAVPEVDTEEPASEDRTLPDSAAEESEEAVSAEAGELENGAWAETYLEHLRTEQAAGTIYDTHTYSLIYVNDDSTPELVIHGGCEADGNRVWTVKDGNLDEIWCSRLYFDYLERQNMLRNSDGHMGYYFDTIYSIENGKWKTVVDGQYYVEDNTVDWDWDDLIYEINGEVMSREEYEKRLNDVYSVEEAEKNNSYSLPRRSLVEMWDLLTGYVSDGYEVQPLQASGDEAGYFEPNLSIHYYEIYVEDVTWYQAHDNALAMGGHLVFIDSEEEFEAIRRKLDEKMAVDNKNYVFWLGGQYDWSSEAPYHYRWFNNGMWGKSILEKEQPYSDWWLEGEPSQTGANANGDSVNEDYMMMFRQSKTGRYVWNDVPEDIHEFYPGRIAYIVEYEDPEY